MSPFWKGSSAFTHLISVDLPEPDGPHTTTTSPLSALVVQFLSTWKLPYHLLTLLNSIMGMTGSPDDRDTALKHLHEIGERETDDEVDDCRERVHLDEAIVAVGDLGGGAGEVGDRDHVHERGVLEQDDRLREQHRQHVAE